MKYINGRKLVLDYLKQADRNTKHAEALVLMDYVIDFCNKLLVETEDDYKILQLGTAWFSVWVDADIKGEILYYLDYLTDAAPTRKEKRSLLDIFNDFFVEHMEAIKNAGIFHQCSNQFAFVHSEKGLFMLLDIEEQRIIGSVKSQWEGLKFLGYHFYISALYKHDYERELTEIMCSHKVLDLLMKQRQENGVLIS